MKGDVQAVKELFAAQNEETVEDEVHTEPESIDEPAVSEPLELEESEEGAAVEEVEPEAEGEDSSEDITNIAQLAEAIEVEPEYLYGMEIGMGEGKDPVKLGELKDMYQSMHKENDDLKGQLEEQSNQLANASGQQQQGQQVSQEMMTAAADIDAIRGQYEQTNWAEIEADDPGQAALLKQKFQEAYQGAQGRFAQAENNQNQYKHQNLQAAAHRTLELIPTWKDETIRHSDQAEMKQAMHEAGYSPNEIQGMQDPIGMSLLRELIMLRKEKSQATSAVKKVKAAPKILRGGNGKFQAKKQDNINKLTNAARNAKVGKKRGAELAAAKAILGL